MTRLLFYVALVVVPLLVGFAGGAATAVIRGWGDRDVRVDVVNESGQRVRSLVLEVDSCGARSVLARAALEPGDRATVRFAVCGEGAYGLRAQLEDGVELHGRGGYVEAGYRSTERLQRKGVVSAVPALSY